MTPPAALRVLFVCTGNTCRSPMAQFLAERLAREAGLPWKASSAGVAALRGMPLSPGAARALAARGLTGLSHSSRPLAAAAVRGADRIYALASDHRAAVLELFPDAAGKVAVLRQAAGLPDADVADPIGQGDAAYERCAARIEEALILLIQRSSHAESAR